MAGAGYTGRRLVDELGSATGLSRSTDPSLDLDDPDAQLGALPDIYSVVYTIPPAASAAETDPRLSLFLSLLAPKPQRVVYLSTTGVYGDRRGERIDESVEPTPATDRAKRRVAAESTLRDWGRTTGVDVVVLRVPGIYGPGRLGIERVRDGVPVLDEQDARPGNRIHVDDLVSCCVAALSADVPAGTYNVGDGDERSSTWFTMEVARQVGVEAPPTVSMAEAERSFPEGRLSFLRESRRLDLAKMHDILGVTPRYADAAKGIHASLAADSATR